MKVCLRLRGRKSWCRSTREWWAPSSPQWFLGVSQVLQSSVTKPWNHISPRKRTNVTPWCPVLTSYLWFMGRVYLPTQWGQSHRRHYLYWPRTGIYQSDRIRSSTDDILLDPVSEMIIPTAPIYSCRSICRKHSMLYLKDIGEPILFQTCQFSVRCSKCFEHGLH